MSYNPLLLTSGLLGSLGDLTAGFLGLGHTLDDAHSHGLIIEISQISYNGAGANILVSCHGRRNVPRVGSR